MLLHHQPSVPCGIPES